MPLHDGEFTYIQLSRFEQDVIRRTQLAHVVHRRRDQQCLLHVFVQPHFARNQRREMRHPQDVRSRFRVAELCGAGQLVQCLALALENFCSRAANFFGQRSRVVRQGYLAAAQRQHVLHARCEFDAVERFGQEIVGAGLERAITHLALVVGSDHQQRRLGSSGGGAELLDELDAVHVRHHVIHDDQVGILAQAMRERFGR
jgi:hypothetical protein